MLVPNRLYADSIYKGAIVFSEQQFRQPSTQTPAETHKPHFSAANSSQKNPICKAPNQPKTQRSRRSSAKQPPTTTNKQKTNHPTQSTADIKESNNYLRVTELTSHDRKINIPLTSHMHQLRQTNRPRNRSHKIPLPQLRRNPNQTRRKMPQIRTTIQMPQMRLHRTIKRHKPWAA